MALFNEILVGRYNRFLQKLLSMKGQPPAPQLAGDITPSLALFSGAENRYLEGWNRVGGRVLVAAVAANSSAGRLFNPAGSNVIAVIERVVASLGASSSVLMSVTRNASSATYPLAGSQLPFDARNQSISGASSGGTALVQGKNNNATTFGIIVGSFSLAATQHAELIFTDVHEVPLLPGDSLDVTVLTVNVQGDFTFWWRERSLEESELK